MHRLPPLTAVRSFEAAARHLSFNRAAEELHVTPSAVSHQIKSLEAFLGIRMFERAGRKIRLTAAGEQYLHPVQDALNEIAVATRRIMATPENNAVTLSVAPAFLTSWLIPKLMVFQEQYPEVELRLSASMDLVDFGRQTDIDMAIRHGQGDWRDVVSHYLIGVAMVPVCSPKLQGGRRPLREPRDLAGATLLHVSARIGEWRTWLHAVGIDDIDAEKGPRFSSTSLATNAAIQGVGVALADRTLVQKHLERGDLVIPFDIELETPSAFYLVYPVEGKMTRAMAAFRDWLLAEVNEERDPHPEHP